MEKFKVLIFLSLLTILLVKQNILWIRSVINPLLADHVVREAEHFLFMIRVLEERLKQKQKETNM
jgi:hypothetical protein